MGAQTHLAGSSHLLAGAVQQVVVLSQAELSSNGRVRSSHSSHWISRGARRTYSARPPLMAGRAKSLYPPPPIRRKAPLLGDLSQITFVFSLNGGRFVHNMSTLLTQPILKLMYLVKTR